MRQPTDDTVTARPAGRSTEGPPAGTPFAELTSQVRRLHDLGYPGLAGLGPEEFDALLEPLLGLPQPAPGEDDGTRIPFLLVVRDSLVPTVDAVERWSVRGKGGFTDMAAELRDYRPIEGVDVPAGPVYLLVDVGTGAETLGVPPDDALPMVRAAGRTPLTIAEGVALVTQYPEVFFTHNAFQALASRADNKRVPSFWMSKGAPRLGWCWAGNPHSWLGAASAAGRLDPT